MSSPDIRVTETGFNPMASVGCVRRSPHGGCDTRSARQRLCRRLVSLLLSARYARVLLLALEKHRRGFRRFERACRRIVLAEPPSSFQVGSPPHFILIFWGWGRIGVYKMGGGNIRQRPEVLKKRRGVTPFCMGFEVTPHFMKGLFRVYHGLWMSPPDYIRNGPVRSELA